MEIDEQASVAEVDTEDRNSKEAKIMKIGRIRPNFFLAFKVYDCDIHRNVRMLQKDILERNPALHPALISIPSLHVTLAVTNLKNEVEIKTMKDTLDTWTSTNRKFYFGEPLILNFVGTNSFDNRVAYVDIEKNEAYEKLCSLAESLNESIQSAGFTREQKPVIPHLTILKLKYPRDRKLLRTKRELRDNFEFIKENSTYFGKQEISHIQLLSMDEPKCEDGYYKCFHQIDVGENKEEIDHSECCAQILLQSGNNGEATKDS